MSEGNPKYRPRREAAQFLTDRGYPTAQRTLEKLACVGGGPIYQLFGRRALYTDDNLIAWAESRTSAPRSNTSEGGRHAVKNISPALPASEPDALTLPNLNREGV